MKTIMLVLLMTVTGSEIGLAEPRKPGGNVEVTQGLKPEQRQAIQGISRAVLAAKHSQKQDPGLRQFRQRVKALRKAVREFGALNVSVEKGVVTIVNQSDLQAKKQQSTAKPRTHPKRRAAREKLGSALASLRSHREAMKSKGGPTSGGMERALIENAKVKCEEFEQEVEQLLDLKPSEQPAKLEELLEHMAPSQLAGQAAHGVNETPTISTITRHRE